MEAGEAGEVNVAAVSDLLADQLRLPSGPLAPFTARLLNHRNLALIERSIRLLDVQPGQRVLDIGFGGAVSLVLLLQRAAGGHVCGIDPSPEMVSRALRMMSADVAAGRLALEVAGAGAIPCGDASVDRVLTVQTVYFWDDLGEGLGEIARVLAPGGRLAIGMMPRSAQEHNGFVRRGYHVLGADDLAALMEGAGFEAVTAAPGPADDPVVLVGRRSPIEV
jgi:arsenite methyltransferase